MALRNEFKAIVPFLSPNELYQKHRTKIDADASGGQALLGYLLAALFEAFEKLRITRTEEIPVGSANVRQELGSLLAAMLSRARRGDTDASMRFSFEVIHDEGHKKRMVTVDVSLAHARIAVIGAEPIHGIEGFLREKGRYAQERKAAASATGTVDHYTTGCFSQTQKGELLAIIDNSRVAGEPGIDVRGSIVKPQHGVKYVIEIGDGVERRERLPGKIELLSAINGVVKTRYDAEGKLRFLAVDGTLKLGEVGFRAGGNVMGRGVCGRGEAISVETAEFRSIPGAFETRTNGAIFVKETIQGKVVGASVTAELVNQVPGKFVVATEGAITVTRSVQGGFLYAPEIVVGNGSTIATLMNGHLAARNRFSGLNLLLAGRNRLVLGSDLFQEKDCDDKCAISGRDLFAGRRMLAMTLKQKQAEFKTHSDAIGKEILAPIQRKISAGQPMNKDLIQRMLTATTALERQFSLCPVEEEDALRLKISNLFYDIGVENPLPVLQRFAEKKRLAAELADLEAKLGEMTQEIDASIHIAECKDGSILTLRCWEDELVVKGFEGEMRIERPASEERLYLGPKQAKILRLAFDYETEKLTCEIEG